jgi:hypothetical protein
VTRDGGIDKLPGWTFEVDEVLAGVFRVRAIDESGHSVERTGTDAEALIEACCGRRSKTEHIPPVENGAP